MPFADEGWPTRGGEAKSNQRAAGHLQDFRKVKLTWTCGSVFFFHGQAGPWQYTRVLVSALKVFLRLSCCMLREHRGFPYSLAVSTAVVSKPCTYVPHMATPSLISHATGPFHACCTYVGTPLTHALPPEAFFAPFFRRF